MKIAAYSALAYGSPYLFWAIRSVIEHVDEYIVLYSDYGSHSGHQNANKPPSEARHNLHSIAASAAEDKLIWIDGDWRWEGQQRDSIWQHTKADLLLVVDYDEIWNEETIRCVIESASTSQQNIRLPLIHFWRSFHRAVTDDMAAPHRVLLRGARGETTLDHKLAHFGYAIPTWLMAYKWTLHGHIAELRPDWFENKWLTNAQVDVHPTNLNGYWNPVEVNPLEHVPAWMKLHPFMDMEVIE